MSLSKHRWFLALLLLGLVVRALPLLYYSYYDPDHFYHVRMAEQFVVGQGVPVYDALSYGGRPYTYYPLYHGLLALPMLLFGVDARTAFALVSLLFGLAAMLGVYALARTFWKERVALGVLLFFALTPIVFARSTVFSRPDGLALAMLVLVALCVVRNWLLGVAAISLALSFANLPGAIVALPLFSLWGLLERKKKSVWQAAFTAVVFVAVGLVYYLSLPWDSFQLSAVTLTSEEIRSLDFFSLFAYGGAAWIFALFGVYLARKERWARLPNWAWGWLGIGIASILVAIRNIAFAAVPVSMVAALGLEQGLRKTKHLSKWLVVIVVAALVVEVGVYYDTVKPIATPGLISALQWAGANTPCDAVFLSLWDRGHMITGLAGRRVVMDGYFEFAPNPTERNAVVMSFFHGGEQNAVNAMRAYNASYVLVDERMREVVPQSTALSQLDSWKSFEKVFDNKAARIYRLR